MNKRTIYLLLFAAAVMTACVAPRSDVQSASLTSVQPLDRSQTWQLVAMRGKEMKLQAGVAPTTIVFNSEAGSYRGFAPCNTYYGNYTAQLLSQEADGDHYELSLKLEGSGSIGCPDAIMNAEGRYLSLLLKADGMLLTAYTLTLTQHGKEILKYELQ